MSVRYRIFILCKQPTNAHQKFDVQGSVHRKRFQSVTSKMQPYFVTLRLVGYTLELFTMHGPLNIKFINDKQAKETYQYENIKRKPYKANAAIWFNKICRQ